MMKKYYIGRTQTIIIKLPKFMSLLERQWVEFGHNIHYYINYIPLTSQQEPNAIKYGKETKKLKRKLVGYINLTSQHSLLH